MNGLNEQAALLCDSLAEQAEALRVRVAEVPGGGRLIDCGVQVEGGLEAGRRLAEICLAGRGMVELPPDARDWNAGPTVCVRTDDPVTACMATQYAGWEITLDNYFAIGSGPMRAAAGGEAIFDRIGHREQPRRVVGVLETSKLPDAAAFETIAEKCQVKPGDVTLLAARTASQAGNIQIVARSIETALHKLDTLGFDLSRVASGFGTAPLPPVAQNDLAGIGRTNDAILYGGQVALYVRGDDASLQEIGPRVPSCASNEHGEPFAEIFEKHGRDFYQIDPGLFSPAVISLVNLDTGNSFRFGRLEAGVIRRSFGLE